MKFDFIKVKREREKHITRLHLILFGLVVIGGATVLIILGVNKANKMARYHKLERDFNTAARYYFDNKIGEIRKSEVKILTMKEIVDSGYLQDEITSKCKGYTLVRNQKNLDDDYSIEYESYINCGDYSTTGYDEEILNQQ